MTKTNSVALRLAVFDEAAATYDDEFTRTPTAQLMRRAVWTRADANFRAPMRVLELGCGTGEDAVHLAQRGIHVTATDASAAMLAITKRKAAGAGLSDLIETAVLDMNALDGGPPTADGALWSAVGGPPSFDGVFSNFGALNCVANLESLLSNIYTWTKPYARLVLVVMGPFCPWEIAWHLAHLKPCQAFRRFARAGAVAHVGGGEVRVWYPSPRTLIKSAAPQFKHIRTSGLGVFVPPPYIQKPVASSQYPDTPAHKRLATGYWLLNTLERRLAHHWPFNQCGDHYILELERR
ncbi:MAG: methyltransferase domain-containing protein [Chloroflexota bacterium]